jgi:membrane fusion protein, multidrug efflux system
MITWRTSGLFERSNAKVAVVLFVLATAFEPVNAQTPPPLKPNVATRAANSLASPQSAKPAAALVGAPIKFGDLSPVRVLLVPDKETTVSSTIAARINVFNGTLGQSFKSGDLLIAFDCEEALARVDMSKAELAGAIDQHEAKVKMQGLGQASDVEVALAASAANKAKAQLTLNQVQVSQCKVYAPWGGRVAKANVKNYMTVTPGQALMELVNDGPLKLKLNAPSKLLGKVRAGSKFDVTIDETGAKYAASVTAINSRVDPVSQTVEIEARMIKSYRELLSGMSGVADLSAFN